MTVAAGVLAASAIIVFVLVCWSTPAVGGCGPMVLGGAHLLLVWGGLVWIAWRGWLGNGIVRERLLVRNLIVLVLADAVLTTVISKPTMYANRKAWKELDERRVASLDLTQRGLSRLPRAEGLTPATLNGHLPLKIPVLESYTPFSSHFHQRIAAHPILAGIGLGAERTWFSSSAAKVPLSDESMDRLVRWSESRGRPCLVVTDPSDVLREGASPPPAAQRGLPESLSPAELISTTTVEYKPDRLVLDVEAPGRGWVLVTDRWAPGWQARVNGRAQQVWLGNLIYRAVEVEAGRNRIEFVYRPFGHPWLLWASWAVLGAAMLGPGVIGGSSARQKGRQV